MILKIPLEKSNDRLSSDSYCCSSLCSTLSSVASNSMLHWELIGQNNSFLIQSSRHHPLRVLHRRISFNLACLQHLQRFVHLVWMLNSFGPTFSQSIMHLLLVKEHPSTALQDSHVLWMRWKIPIVCPIRWSVEMRNIASVSWEMHQWSTPQPESLITATLRMYLLPPQFCRYNYPIVDCIG